MQRKICFFYPHHHLPCHALVVSKPTKKREPCKLNERKKKLQVKSSSCVCDAPHVRAGRCTEVSPSTARNRTPTPPQPRDTCPTPAGEQASQAKPHQKHTQHKTTPKSQIKTYPPTLLLRLSSSALVQLICRPTTHSNECTDIEKDASSIPSTIFFVMTPAEVQGKAEQNPTNQQHHSSLHLSR